MIAGEWIFGDTIMTTLSTRFGTDRELEQRFDFGEEQRQRREEHERRVNVGQNERAVSVAAGAILAIQGISRGTITGLLTAAVGGMLINRGASGHCGMYQRLGLDTAKDRDWMEPEEISEKGIHVEQSMLINKPADELYRYWRNFENLPAI